MRVIFQRESGVTFDTVDARILAISTRCDIVDGRIVIDTPHVLGTVAAILSACNYNHDIEANCDITVRSGQLLPDTLPEAATDEPCVVPNENTIVRELPADMVTPFVPARVHSFEVTEEKILETLAHIVSPEGGSAIHLYAGKVAEYNRIWGQAVKLKREVDKAMVAIKEDEVVSRLTDDIEYIKTRRDDIELVELGEGADIVIVTKPVITENQPEYGSRSLGRIRFVIDLRYLYSQNPPSTNYADAVRFDNLDMAPSYSDRNWVCGHVSCTDGNTTICYGGYYQHLFEAFVAGDITLLIDVLMRFVKRPNETDEWGKVIQAFPEVVNES